MEFSFYGQARLRLLEPGDLPGMEWHGGPDFRAFNLDLWQGHQEGRLTVVILDVAGFPAGQIVIHWDGKPAHLEFPDQQSLRVHPAFRGMGFGTHLINCSESVVAARGFLKAGLSVNVENSGARRLYERLGYRVIGEPYLDSWHYIDAHGERVTVEERVVDMVKQLPSPLATSIPAASAP